MATAAKNRSMTSVKKSVGSPKKVGRSNNNFLTLDKDVNELQLTYEMFQDQLNQFNCLRVIA